MKRQTPRPNRRGVTFTEVMFAVVLLGIGFIMLAGIFPFAIQQTQVSGEETNAANLAQGAVKLIERLATKANFDDADGEVHRVSKDVFEKLGRELISQQDPRFAWVPLYRRQADQNYMQVFIITLQSRYEGGLFTPDIDLVRQPSLGKISPIEPRNKTSLASGGKALKVDCREGDPDRVFFKDGEPDFIAEGAFLIIADGAAAGRFYRLGQRINTGEWSLMPGYDMAVHAGADNTFGTGDDIDENVDNASAFMIGVPVQNDGVPIPPSAMDTGIYTTFITLR